MLEFMLYKTNFDGNIYIKADEEIRTLDPLWQGDAHH